MCSTADSWTSARFFCETAWWICRAVRLPLAQERAGGPAIADVITSRARWEPGGKQIHIANDHRSGVKVESESLGQSFVGFLEVGSLLTCSAIGCCGFGRQGKQWFFQNIQEFRRSLFSKGRISGILGSEIYAHRIITYIMTIDYAPAALPLDLWLFGGHLMRTLG